MRRCALLETPAVFPGFEPHRKRVGGPERADGGDEAERVGAREGVPPAGAERRRVGELGPEWRFGKDGVIDAEARADVH